MIARNIWLYLFSSLRNLSLIESLIILYIYTHTQSIIKSIKLNWIDMKLIKYTHTQITSKHKMITIQKIIHAWKFSLSIFLLFNILIWLSISSYYSIMMMMIVRQSVHSILFFSFLNPLFIIPDHNQWEMFLSLKSAYNEMLSFIPVFLMVIMIKMVFDISRC